MTQERMCLTLVPRARPSPFLVVLRLAVNYALISVWFFLLKRGQLSLECVQFLKDQIIFLLFSCRQCTRPTGKVVLVGLGKDTVEVPLVSAILKQLDILGMVRFSNNYDTAIEAISSGKINVKRLITHRYSLNEAVAAFNAALNREGAKIIIDCNKATD
uniref:Alcohol dehydrogenase-like C-terminal domain-containing protein n=1 Tax=Biomphalaria glabrata TaxID=6526 RepID=A0A2C9KKA9_BIOGL